MSIASSIVRFEIPGPPQVKQRARQGKGGWFTPQATAEYEERVAWASKAAFLAFRSRFVHDELVRVRLDLSSDTVIATVSRLERPVVGGLRGDIDNYAKAILDGMQKGGLLANDRQVAELELRIL